MISRRTFFLVSLVGVFAASGAALAQKPKNVATVVTISGEMCGGCVKKMQSALSKVPGIASVQGDVSTKTMTITPKSQVALSPKAVWDAIEAAGKKPAKLSGPSGVFATKPKA